jgi:putative transposase
VKYAFIQEKLAETNNPHRLGAFCRMLEVSRSGYYDWVDRSTQPDPDTLALEVAARAAHARGRKSYGPKRLRTELTEMGFPRSLALIKRLRKRLGLRCRHKRRIKRTTDGNHALPIAPNLLEQRFNDTTALNQVWVTDITYVHTDEGWLRPAGRKFAPVLPQSKICLIKRSSAGERRPKLWMSTYHPFINPVLR